MHFSIHLISSTLLLFVYQHILHFSHINIQWIFYKLRPNSYSRTSLSNQLTILMKPFTSNPRGMILPTQLLKTELSAILSYRISSTTHPPPLILFLQKLCACTITHISESNAL